MQRPLFVDAPRSADGLRAAFSLYYKGISIDFSLSGPLRQVLLAYADFRRRHGLDNGESATPGRTDLKAREEEEALLGNIAAAVLQRADEAREMLRDYAVMLPQEQNPETGTEALVSPELRPIAMRGLLDPALRDSTWPRDMAWLVIGGMEHASYANGNRVMVLDVTATATVAGAFGGGVSMSYLVFPRVRVQAANMLSASFLMGGPPVFAAYGLGEALCFHLGGGAKVTGMALIHHNREALGQSFYGVFSPQQRRAAAFTFGKSANGSDYSSKNPHALSLQPVACAHLRVSIIWELEQVAGVKEAREFLHRARLSGGLVTGHGEIVLEDSLEAAFDRVGNGYVVTDRRDMLEDKGKNQAELLVEALGAQPSAGEDNTMAVRNLPRLCGDHVL